MNGIFENVSQSQISFKCTWLFFKKYISIIGHNLLEILIGIGFYCIIWVYCSFFFITPKIFKTTSMVSRE